MKFLKIGLAFSVAAFSNLSQASAPQPPTNVRAVADNRKVSVSWTAPVDTGGLAIKNYTVRIRSTHDGRNKKCSVSGKKTSCAVKGLFNNRTYSFFVVAKNKEGYSSASEESNLVIPYYKDVNAQCGTANGVYYTDTPPSTVDLCSTGGGFPAVRGEDGIYYWSCAGLRQGSAVNCKSSGTPTYKPGDRGPAGGTVIFATPDKQHGIEAATVPLYSTSWGCDGTYVGANGTNVGTGKDNTKKILAACPDSPAANKANKEKLYGYDDWYIPSKDEMVLAERVFAGAEPGIEFWTSSEVSASLVTMYHRRVAPCTNPPPFGDCYYEYISEPGTKSCSGYLPRYISGKGCWVLPVRDF